MVRNVRFNRIRIVLVRTFHPGNIGASLRALVTMGLHDLVLVSPERFPDGEVIKMAASTADLVAKIKVCESLTTAVADCHLVIGTSARHRSTGGPILNLKQGVAKLVSEATKFQVALVFGSEKTGLSAEDLQLCNYRLTIDADTQYPVLNLSHAVQILAYEIREKYQSLPVTNSKIPDYPSNEELERFYSLLELTLDDIGFIIAKHPGEIMHKLRRMFARTRIESIELNILYGILARIRQNAMLKN